MIRLPEQLMFIRNGRAEQKHSEESMTGKLCVITGASSGVGYESMKALAAGGADIVMVIRNQEKAIAIKDEIEKKYSVRVDYFIADFSDLRQVEKAAHAINEQYPRINVLINSAGIHSTKRVLNNDGVELVFCINHLASFLFTKLLLTKMTDSSPSRIIQINSEGHRFSTVHEEDINWNRRRYTGLRGYGASKTAQLLTVWKMAEELDSTGVTINAMHPGGVRTNIGNNNGRLYRWFLHHVTWHFLKDAKISGDAVYYLASASELMETSGKYFNLTIEEKVAEHALDRNKQKIIWKLSKQMTGLDRDR